MSKLTYTRAIKGGKLRATEMGVGESVTGTVKGFKPGKYGSSILIDVNGKEVEIFAAGNLKFFEQNVNEGKFALNAYTEITRIEDIVTKAGFKCSKFDIFQDQGNATQAAPAAASSAAATTDVAAKLAEIRARRPQGANS